MIEATSISEGEAPCRGWAGCCACAFHALGHVMHLIQLTAEARLVLQHADSQRCLLPAD